MNQVIPVDHRPVDQTVSVAISTNKLCVLVYQNIKAVLQVVVQNVLQVLSVPKIEHAIPKNASTPVLIHVVKMLNVKSSITVQFVVVSRAILETLLLGVKEYHVSVKILQY